MATFAHARAASSVFAVPLLSLLTLATGCNPGDLLGIGGDSGNGTYTPNYNKQAPAHRAELPCGDSDPQDLCVALNYVTYQDSAGRPIVTKNQAASNIQELNSTWAQCHLQFYLENYVAADPLTLNLDAQPSTSDELTTVRQKFADQQRLSVVTTGQWTGQLGSQGPNAWTEMPPYGPFGAVLEASVGTIAGLIAHELGHYLNLPHVTDNYNVMNPIVYANSINITDAQCSEARATAIDLWAPTLR